MYGPELSAVHHEGFGGFAAGAAPGLLAMLCRAGLHDGLVVDLACGSGVWARALRDAGYDVLGVDVSPSMIALARAEAPGARFAVGSLHAVEIPPCAAVTCIGEGLGYLGAEDPREAMPALLARVHRALRPGGLLVFDLVLRSERDPMRYRAHRDGPGWSVEVEVDEAPEASLLTRRIRTTRGAGGEARVADEVHHVRTFGRGEVEGALRAAGFSVRVHRRYGDMPLAPRRLAFRARRPPRR